jgi:hypothetical protein
MPLVLSGQLASSCPQPPPAGINTVGQAPCGTWYDNDHLNNGNFGFLSLNPQGWNVPAGDNCSGATAGSNDIGDWVSGADPVSVPLNWTQPTYVCNIGGFKGQSHPWNELEILAQSHAVRDFPITWEGPGSPGFGAPPQGYFPGTGKIDKYDVIGFAALRIIDVLRSQEAQGDPPQDDTCSKNNTNAIIPVGTYPWTNFASAIGCSKPPPTSPVDAVTNVTVDGLMEGTGYTYDTTGITLLVPIPRHSNVSFDWHMDATDGPCGPPPNDSSAKCVITQWLGSTLTGDYPTDQLDNIRVVRLCDLVQGTCLDQ